MLVDEETTKKLFDLNNEKHYLIRKMNNKQITEEEGNIKVNQIQLEVDAINKNILAKNDEEIKKLHIPQIQEEIKTEVPEMAKDKEAAPAAEKKEKKEVKSRENSNAQLIMKALQMKSTKTWEDVAKKVKEWKPEADEKKVMNMGRVIVKEITAGKGGKAKKYKWNETEFKLIPVEGEKE